MRTGETGVPECQPQGGKIIVRQVKISDLSPTPNGDWNVRLRGEKFSSP